jgi:hypothetical protein
LADVKRVLSCVGTYVSKGLQSFTRCLSDFSSSSILQKVDGPALGIDLGTSFCCVTIYDKEKEQVDISMDEEGNHIFPSYVAFTGEEILVGDSAKYQAARNPSKTTPRE